MGPEFEADNKPPLTQQNHFVPQVYLRGWADLSARLWAYRTLVSASSVRQWRQCSVRSVGRLQHLYSRVASRGVTDEVERWLARHVDEPVQGVLRRVEAETRLSQNDWFALIRFFAAGQARTPAFFLRRMNAWQRDLPPLIKSSLEETVRKLSEGKAETESVKRFEKAGTIDLPMLARTRRNPSGEGGVLEAEVLTGRTLWLYELERLVLHTANALRAHAWTILCPPSGSEWLTSDDPVICLQYNGPSNYAFQGGWGARGTELIMPLSPRHLLYARVGYRSGLKYTSMPAAEANEVQRMTVMHAHRMVFGATPHAEVAGWRPRVENAELFMHEKGEWERFHQSQSHAEAALQAGVGQAIVEPVNAVTETDVDG